MLIDKWGSLLEHKFYWTTLQVTAWVVRLANDCKAKVNKTKKSSGPLTTEEIKTGREYWILRAQDNIKDNLARPGWKFEKDL